MLTRRLTPFVVLAMALLLAVLGRAAAAALTPREIADRTTGSVVLVLLEDARRHACSLASGFVVADGVVATNLHALRNAAVGRVKAAGAAKAVDIAGVAAVDAAHDLVLLAVPGVTAPALTLFDGPDPAVGEHVYVVGNPRGLEGTFSQGIVSGLRKIGDDQLLQITAPISPGSSGGPVLNGDGHVIGVAVATFQGGQNLNFAIPVAYLRSLVAGRGTGALRPLSDVSGVKPGEEPFFMKAGGRNTEGVSGSAGLWDLSYYGGGYSFSLRNHLQVPVRNVSVAVLFLDEAGEAIEANLVRYAGVIPPGMARRVQSQVDNSVHELFGTGYDKSHKIMDPKRIEFRILDFEVVGQ